MGPEDTVWSPRQGQGEYIPAGSQNDITDSSGNLLVDNNSNFVVDSGVTFNGIPDTTWEEDDTA